MKSVGEAMAVGRCFAESLQKALRSLEIGVEGLDEMPALDEALEGDLEGALAGGLADEERLKSWIAGQVPDRIFRIAHAMRRGLDVDSVHAITHWIHGF